MQTAMDKHFHSQHQNSTEGGSPPTRKPNATPAVVNCTMTPVAAVEKPSNWTNPTHRPFNVCRRHLASCHVSFMCESQHLTTPSMSRP